MKFNPPDTWRVSKPVITKLPSTTKEHYMTVNRGYVITDYDSLVKTFGPPSIRGSSDNKVRVKWVLKADDGTIITIYDYKENVPITQMRWFNVGGFSRDKHELDILQRLGFNIAEDYYDMPLGVKYHEV